MTNESQTIAEAVDQFPQHVRKDIRDATLRLVDVYAATTMRTLVRTQDEHLPANVIRFHRLRGGSRRSGAMPD